MICPSCGGDNHDNYKFCRHCGTKRPEQPPMQQPGYTQPAPPSYTPQPQQPVYTPPPAYPPSPPPYQPAYPGGAPATPPPMQQKMGGQKRKGVAPVLIGLVVLCVLAAMAVVFVWQPPWMPRLNANYLMAGFPVTTNEADLYLFKKGDDKKDGVQLVSNARETTGWFWTDVKNDVTYSLSKGSFSYGGFIPNSKYLLYWYKEDDNIKLRRITVGKEDADTILDTTAEYFFGPVYDGGGRMIVVESRQGQARCYISKSGKEAERLGKGENCYASNDGKTLLVSDKKAEKTTLTAYNTSSKDDTVLFEDWEGVDSVQVSYNGNRVAVLQSGKDKVSIKLLDRENGDELNLSDEYAAINAFGFAAHKDYLFFIAENNDGLLELFTMDKETVDSIATGNTLSAGFSANGEQLIFMTGDENGEKTLTVHPMKSGDNVEVAKGDELSYAILESPARILVREQKGADLTLSSAKITGEEKVILLSQDATTLDNLFYVPGKSRLYLVLRNKDNLQSLYVVSDVDKEDGYSLIEEWAEISLLNLSPNGKQLVLAGREEQGVDPVLYSLTVEDGEKPVDLDDNITSVVNAVFNTNNKSIVYTARTGSDLDEIEIRQTNADGKDKPEKLYVDAFLIDAQWASMDPFQSPSWQEVTGGTSFCPGAPTIKVGDTLEDKLKTDKGNCYRFRSDASKKYTFVVKNPSNAKTKATLYEKSGGYLASQDSRSGNSTILKTTITDAGNYFVMVEGYNFAAESGKTPEYAYQISLYEGDVDPTFANATVLPAGARTRGVITNASAVYLESYKYSTFGNMYFFDGKAGQKVTVEVFAKSIGSEITPRVLFFDPNRAALAEDKMTVNDAQDAIYQYTLRTDGKHYVLVQDANNRHGPESTFFYEVLLTIK